MKPTVDSRGSAEGRAAIGSHAERKVIAVVEIAGGNAGAGETVVVVRAMAEDASAIAALLGAASLPQEDFRPRLEHFLVARRGAEVVGAVGAEVHGPDALLRSLVVSPSLRRRGVGDRLVTELETLAEGWGVTQWWLLTTTAAGFFQRRGFREAPRAGVPAAIAATAQFQGLCPSVAVCLTRAGKSQ